MQELYFVIGMDFKARSTAVCAHEWIDVEYLASSTFHSIAILARPLGVFLGAVCAEMLAAHSAFPRGSIVAIVASAICELGVKGF